jgi:hypothetical protein
MPPRRRKRVLWTAADLKVLKKLAGREPTARIARQLKRSPAAVRYKAWEKGIRLNRKRA